MKHDDKQPLASPVPQWVAYYIYQEYTCPKPFRCWPYIQSMKNRDGQAPIDARPSVGLVLTAKLDMISCKLHYCMISQYVVAFQGLV